MRFSLATALGGPGRDPAGSAELHLGLPQRRAVDRSDTQARAYRSVAVSAGMLLRKVKIITTNMKTRRRGLLRQAEVHFPAAARPGPEDRF